MKMNSLFMRKGSKTILKEKLRKKICKYVTAEGLIYAMYRRLIK